MMTNYSFRKDLDRSKATTELAKYILENNEDTWFDRQSKEEGWFVNDVNDRTCDFHLLTAPGGRDILVEIKEDFYCQKSGNVAVEYECRGKFSGILTTEADFWLYRIHVPPDGESLWVITPTNKIKEAIDKKLWTRHVTGGDYKSNTKMYLFPLAVFQSLGFELKDKSETPKVHKEKH